MKRIPLESEPTLWSPWTALGRAFRPRSAICAMQKQDGREISRPSAVHGDRGSRYTPLAALCGRVAAPSSELFARKMRFHSRSVRSTGHGSTAINIQIVSFWFQNPKSHLSNPSYRAER